MSKYRFELIYKGSKEWYRLVVPSLYWKFLLDKVSNTKFSKFSAHFGSKMMHALLSARVWWPQMRKTC